MVFLYAYIIEGKFVRYVESTITLDKEYRAQHVHFLRHADRAEVNFAIEYLLNGIGGIVVVDEWDIGARARAGFRIYLPCLPP